MPIHLTHVRDETRSVVVDYAGEKMTAEYARNALSTREWREIRKRAAGDAETADDEFAVAVLSRLLKKWDLLDADGPKAKPLPLTKEQLDDLPPGLLNAIVRAITENMFPNEKPDADSSSSF